jgi:hypothetical protein
VCFGVPPDPSPYRDVRSPIGLPCRQIQVLFDCGWRGVGPSAMDPGRPRCLDVGAALVRAGGSNLLSWPMERQKLPSHGATVGHLHRLVAFVGVRVGGCRPVRMQRLPRVSLIWQGGAVARKLVIKVKDADEVRRSRFAAVCRCRVRRRRHAEAGGRGYPGETPLIERHHRTTALVRTESLSVPRQLPHCWHRSECSYGRRANIVSYMSRSCFCWVGSSWRTMS